MQANRVVLESPLSETEMALLIAVNILLDAAAIAGSNGKWTLQHKDNFGAIDKPKAE